MLFGGFGGAFGAESFILCCLGGALGCSFEAWEGPPEVNPFILCCLEGPSQNPSETRFSSCSLQFRYPSDPVIRRPVLWPNTDSDRILQRMGGAFRGRPFILRGLGGALGGSLKAL